MSSKYQKRKTDDYLKGKDCGRKARRAGKPQPVGKGKSDRWLEGMLDGYYKNQSVGKPLEGSSPKVAITVKIDDEIRKRAIALEVNRSQASEFGIDLCCFLSEQKVDLKTAKQKIKTFLQRN